jgi:hypothetical protein
VSISIFCRLKSARATNSHGYYTRKQLNGHKKMPQKPKKYVRKSSVQTVIIPLAEVCPGVYNPPGRACSIMTDSGVSTVEMASSCEFCYARRNRFVFRRGVSKIHTAPPSPVGYGIGCDNSPARPCDRPVPPDGEAEKRKTIAAEYGRGSRDNIRAA